MESIISAAIESAGQVWLSLQHNWPYLLMSLVIAVLLKLYINADKVMTILERYRGASVAAATAAAVATPLCSCGTTAVILGMMASRMTWAPIVAFMVSSPLTSPQELVYSAGLFGWPFALAFFLASIVLGLAGGWVSAAVEKLGWLANQLRFIEPRPAACACPSNDIATAAPSRILSPEAPDTMLGAPVAACGCTAASPIQTLPSNVIALPEPKVIGETQTRFRASRQAIEPVSRNRVSLSAILKEFYISAKYLLVMFVGFAFVGYFLNGLIPASWVAAVFGGGNLYNVPLAATLGLPLYFNTEASLPLIRALLDAGMSQGAALAFMISGAGTSIGAISGALTIARWRVVALVVIVLWLGAILSGYTFNLVLMLKVY